MKQVLISGIIMALTFATPVIAGAAPVCERFTPGDVPGPNNIEQYRDYLAICHGITVREF